MSGDVVFRFESPGISVEFEGPEAFVEAQIARLADRLRQEIEAAVDRCGRKRGAAPPETGPAAGAPATPPAEPTLTLAEFHRRAHSREGRGAIQESILIFAYYLTEMRGQAEVSIDDIAGCFKLAGATQPSNLANTLGIMKRSQGFFDAGDGRGRYMLTSKGAAYVRRLIGAQ